CGIIEGAHHAGDIPQRRTLEQPLGQRLGWVALEVDDHEVFAGIQDLPEVERSMDDRLRRQNLVVQQESETVEKTRFVAHEEIDRFLVTRREIRPHAAQERSQAAKIPAGGLIQRSLVERRKLLACEWRILR